MTSIVADRSGQRVFSARSTVRVCVDPNRDVESVASSSRSARPSHAVYVRRRLIAGLMLCAVCAAPAAAAHAILADRGDVPASTPAILPAIADASQPVASSGVASPVEQYPTYIVQPGDTLWSIAEQIHGGDDLADYVDQLVDSNGGAWVFAGQSLALP